MAGPVTALEWLTGQPPIAAGPAQWLLAAYLLWELVVGLLFLRVHGLLQADLGHVELHPG